ncbi:MAG: GntR family transcriptional regulator, partial [Pseudomonadota bacterium]
MLIIGMNAPQSKSDALYRNVKGDILTLRLAPGTALRLPALSERYGIGLTPLRDCLTRLSAEHLVVPEHNKGFRVAPLSLEGLLDLEQTRSVIEASPPCATASAKREPSITLRVCSRSSRPSSE